MLSVKKVIGVVLGTSAVGGGAVAIKYFLNNNTAVNAITDIELQKAIEKQEIKQAHDLALRICKGKPACDKTRTETILKENQNLKFDFQIR